MNGYTDKFWVDLLCASVNANYGIMKECVDGSMKNEVWNIREQELRKAIKMMKENKATDKSGIIAEKVLEERDVQNLRMLLNEVLNGGCIPNEWKESRDVWVHRGGSKKELENYRPVAIIMRCASCL